MSHLQTRLQNRLHNEAGAQIRAGRRKIEEIKIGAQKNYTRTSRTRLSPQYL
jgi:hypothetical protein